MAITSATNVPIDATRASAYSASPTSTATPMAKPKRNATTTDAFVATTATAPRTSIAWVKRDARNANQTRIARTKNDQFALIHSAVNSVDQDRVRPVLPKA